MPRAIPSRATCRQMPSKAALDASYAGIPVAARRLAAELMNTIAAPGSSASSAAAATRKCARVLTANVWSHWAALVPAIPRPSPIPTFSTTPSRPPSAAAESATTAAHASPPPGQPAAPGRGAGGFGRQGHDSAHIGVVPGGSGTVNAFSRNEISVYYPHSDTSSTIPASPRKRCAAS
jgi:hypothetical protein